MTQQKNIPEVSIDEALELYLSIACPNGLPEGAEKDRILDMMREKISKDRPEWAEASKTTEQEEIKEKENRYSAIKANVIKKAAESEIPEDPEERYLYNRKLEAKENSRQKRAEEKSDSREKKLRNKVIQDKKEQDDEVVKRAALIKKVILDRAASRMAPSYEKTGALNNEKPSFTEAKNRVEAINFSGDVGLEEGISFNDTGYRTETPERQKTTSTDENNSVDTKKWFSDFKSLSMDERLESVKAYNKQRRSLLKTREELMWTNRSEIDKSNSFSLEDNERNVDSGLSIEDNKKSVKGFCLE